MAGFPVFPKPAERVRPNQVNRPPMADTATVLPFREAAEREPFKGWSLA